ncbi:MAG TPA: DNA-binding protein [Gammaproteobacteria bacterium]|nr:DNA-binding protein [Gammaproteobacteria bacterium]
MIKKVQSDTPPILAYSIPQLVEATGLGRSLIYEHIRAGRLRITKVNRRTIVTAEAAHEWLHELEAESGNL